MGAGEEQTGQGATSCHAALASPLMAMELGWPSEVSSAELSCQGLHAAAWVPGHWPPGAA